MSTVELFTQYPSFIPESSFHHVIKESAVPEADQAQAGPNGVFLWLSRLNWERVHLSLVVGAPRYEVELDRGKVPQ